MKNSTFALIILTGINLLNYIDRYVSSALKELFIKDLGISDLESSLPLTTFLIVFMIASPIFGYLVDHGYNRKAFLCGGIVFWSICTGLTYFSYNYASFLVFRTLVGIGEAAYTVIAPVLISDFYAPSKRNKALTIFYTATPIGAALGFMMGGIFGPLAGWRETYLIVGVPGIVIAFLVLKIKDPGRGIHDNPADQEAVSWVETFKFLWRNKIYVNALIGYICITWASGGMADWLPTFFTRYNGASVTIAGVVVGAATVIGGIGGTLIGGYCGDHLKTKTKHPYLAISAVSALPCAALVFLVLFIRNLYVAIFIVIIAQIALWCYNGPISALIANVVPISMRGRAFSITVFSIHLFGDAISPFIIGAISTSLNDNLLIALLPCPIIIFVGAAVWGIGWRTLSEEFMLDDAYSPAEDDTASEVQQFMRESASDFALVPSGSLEFDPLDSRSEISQVPLNDIA